MTNSSIPRRCFICGSEAGAAVLDSDTDVCGLGCVHFAIRCCDGCGLTLQDPAVGPETMVQQYALYSNYAAFNAGDPALSPTARGC